MFAFYVPRPTQKSTQRSSPEQDPGQAQKSACYAGSRSAKRHALMANWMEGGAFCGLNQKGDGAPAAFCAKRHGAPECQKYFQRRTSA